MEEPETRMMYSNTTGISPLTALPHAERDLDVSWKSLGYNLDFDEARHRILAKVKVAIWLPDCSLCDSIIYPYYLQAEFASE